MKRALLLIATYAALGASATEASDPRAMRLTYEPWTKLCFKRDDGNSDCFISAAARGACRPSGGGLSISIRDGKTLSLLVNFGTRRTLEGSIAIQIDQGTPIAISHPDCFGLGCRGKLEIDGEFIERLKRSQAIAVEANDIAHQKLRLSFSLADFAKTYDGPASDPPKAHETSQQQLKEALRQRARRISRRRNARID
jgi:Invasion protein B, involved in pathogenesis